MSKEKEKTENPLAFPATWREDVPQGYESGMTLRDYFAAKAMQSYFSDTNIKWIDEGLSDGAIISYKLADAMLKERNKQ